MIEGLHRLMGSLGSVWLVLDDVQWLDPLGADVMHGLLSRGTPGLRLLATARRNSPQAERLGHRSDVVLVPLDRLDASGVTRMASGMLGMSSAPAGLGDRLFELTDGNPFYVAEYLRTAVETGLLVRHPEGRWALTGSVAAHDLPLPRALTDLVLERLERLPKPTRAALEATAVLGREPTAELLQALGVAEDVDALIWHGWMHGTSRGVRFEHDRLRDGIVASIAEDRLVALHSAAATALTSSTERERHLQAIAIHREAAGQTPEAIDAWLEASHTAMAAYALVDCETACRRFLHLAPTDPRRNTVRHTLALALQGQARLGEALDVLEQARADPSTDGADFAIQFFLFKAHWAAGRREQATAVVPTLDRLAHQIDAPTNRGHVHEARGQLAEGAGRLSEAGEHYLAALEEFRRARDDTYIGNATSYLGNISADLGRHAEARAYYADADAAFARAGARRGQAIVLGNLGILLVELGELEEAEIVCQRALTAHRECLNTGSEAVVLGTLAHLALDRGEIERARSHLDRATELARRLQLRRNLAALSQQSTEVDLAAGELALAAKRATEALDIARALGDAVVLGSALCLYGRVQTLNGGDGRQSLAEAKGIATQLGSTGDSMLGRAIEALELTIDGVAS
jgi:tetratricopeptide (TPR) repeat protein